MVAFKIIVPWEHLDEVWFLGVPETSRAEQGYNVAEGSRVHGPLCTETSNVTHIKPGVRLTPQ